MSRNTPKLMRNCGKVLWFEEATLKSTFDRFGKGLSRTMQANSPGGDWAAYMSPREAPMLH